LRQAAEEIARENGLLRFKLSTAEAEIEATRNLMQRKVTRQARVIRRMEDKLRELRKKPYEGMGFETTPGAEYDAEKEIR
jgi:hypothetical protein